MTTSGASEGPRAPGSNDYADLRWHGPCYSTLYANDVSSVTQ